MAKFVFAVNGNSPFMKAYYIYKGDNLNLPPFLLSYYKYNLFI